MIHPTCISSNSREYEISIFTSITRLLKVKHPDDDYAPVTPGEPVYVHVGIVHIDRNEFNIRVALISMNIGNLNYLQYLCDCG